VAEAKFVLGATVDIASGDELNSGFKGLRDEMRAANAHKPKRILRPITKSVTGLALATGQSVALTIGRPDTGRVWVLTRINVMGDDDTTVKTNLTGALYIGDPANVGIGQCVRFGQTIPWTTTENEHAYVVHDREDAFVYLTATGAVTGQVVVTATAWEYRDVDLESQYI
jgi:hypothetical protein